MKNITLQLQEINGEILEENHLTIGDNDTLIMTFDTASITPEQAYDIFKGFDEALKLDSPLIGFPKGIEFKVLKKG